jgi:hypothetical protein
MNHVGIEENLCPSRSPDGDECIRAADHLDAHRRGTDGRQWSGGVHRPAAWTARDLPVQGSGPRTDAWRIVTI